MQSIRVILASFGLAPAAGMNNLTALLLDNPSEITFCMVAELLYHAAIGVITAEPAAKLPLCAAAPRRG